MHISILPTAPLISLPIPLLRLQWRAAPQHLGSRRGTGSLQCRSRKMTVRSIGHRCNSSSFQLCINPIICLHPVQRPLAVAVAVAVVVAVALAPALGLGLRLLLVLVSVAVAAAAAAAVEVAVAEAVGAGVRVGVGVGLGVGVGVAVAVAVAVPKRNSALHPKSKILVLCVVGTR